MADSSFRINRGITLNPQSSAPTSPTNGDVYYDSTMGTYAFYDNGFWINLSSRADVASASSLTSTQFTSAVVQNSLLRLTGSTTGNIHGLAASTDGKVVCLYNNSSVVLTLNNESATESTAANRIICINSASIALNAGQSVILRYDAGQSRWVVATQPVIVSSVLPMVGNAANDSLDATLVKVDAELGKLFEDRNVLLTDGGNITFTGTQLQFTENLNFVINQRVGGSSPVVISLGSSNTAFTNSGNMWYAVVDRIAGTATTTADATTLPAAVAANQEVFLIAKRIDAGDGTQRVYWRNGMALNAGQTVRLGASGSGSGSGVGDDLDSLTYRASFNELFPENATGTGSSVDATAAHTNATYSAAKQIWTALYDASKTIAAATTITNINLSSTVTGFTAATGDVIVVGGVVRKITAVASQSSFTTEAFPTAPSLGAQVTVSQAVHTKDIYNLAVDGVALSAAFGALTFSEITVDYKDNATSNSNLWTPNTTPFAAFVASPDASNWTTQQVRVTNETDVAGSTILPSAGTSLYLRFYANKTSGTGFVNVIAYKAFMQKSTVVAAGGVINAAYAFTNGVGTPVNCTLAVVGGKTTVTLNFSYAVGVNVGLPYGSIDVYVNGQLLPRFINSTLTPDASYLESSGNVITLDKDYSGINLAVEVLQRVQIVDTSTTNTTNLSALNEIASNGFQSFVNTTSAINVATTTTGTPAAGKFYSSIPNRAPMTDLSQDLKARMGVERMPTQQLYLSQSEWGPNGEAVWLSANDPFGQIRFVGTWTSPNAGSSGTACQTVTSGDYMEVTFYGTGLNLLTFVDTSSYNAIASVDGGSFGSNIFQSTNSALISSLNTNPNIVRPIVSGLTLGIHTVTIKNNTTVTLASYGIEIVNESTSVKTTPGTSYLAGQKLVNSSLSSIGYNAAVTGTRGGRVLVYQASDGTIAQAFTPVNTSQANVSAADHTNEEVARVYHWTEFGAGRSDDFSLGLINNANLTFVMEDGTTALVGSSVSRDTGTNWIGLGATNAFLMFTFVGTGLDIVRQETSTAGTETVTYSIDGTVISTDTTPQSATSRVVKIVSGLPYGTHTFKFLRSAATTNNPALTKFIVYQPKKPTLPSNAVELADYNVMANYVFNLTTSPTASIQSNGVLKKMWPREVNFTGTGWNTSHSFDGSETSGINTFSNVIGGAVSYTFFGTGVEFRFVGGTSNTGTISIDGSTNLSGYTTQISTSTGLTLTPSTGAYNQGSGGSYGCSISISNIPLGIHTIKVTGTNNSTGSLQFECFDVITPIHSYKSNLYQDVQNTLIIGSQGISDNRKITPIKEAQSSQKAWAQAFGVTVDPTTTSTTPIPCPDMSLTVKTNGGRLQISYSVMWSINALNPASTFQLYVDGVAVGTPKQINVHVNGDQNLTTDIISVPIAPGVHKVDLYWFTSSATLKANGTQRNITAEER